MESIVIILVFVGEGKRVDPLYFSCFRGYYREQITYGLPFGFTHLLPSHDLGFPYYWHKMCFSSHIGMTVAIISFAKGYHKPSSILQLNKVCMSGTVNPIFL
jgi:hypothetical protein